MSFDDPQADPTAPSPPAVEHAPTAEEMLAELLTEQKAHRAEVQALRDEVAASKAPVVGPSAQVQSADDLLAQRMSEIAQHPYYCPGCGLLYDYQRECRGKAESPHPPIEVISTDELKSGDSSKHTPAPVLVQ